MWSKRATWTLADILYWFFYIPLTLIVIIALWKMPASMLDAAVQPYKLDATIMEQRIYSNLDQYDHATGTQIGILTPTPQDIKFSPSDKAFAVKTAIKDKTYYINEEFYKDAKPLAPARYQLITSTKKYQTASGPTIVTVEQVYPPRYERLT